MNKLIFTGFLAVFSLQIAFAQNFDSRVRLTFDNVIASDNNLVFGAITSATDSLDKLLGETDIPPFPPPTPDLFVVFNWDTTDPSGRWTYNDFRSVPEDKQEFFHRYKAILFKRVNSIVTISWSSLPSSIKSAVISDKLGGILFSADMKSTQSVTINNTVLDKIDIHIDVVYDKKGLSVSDNISENWEVFPNPAIDFIKVINEDNINAIEIFNLYGEIVLTKENMTTENNIDVSKLSSGYYSVRITRSDNTISYGKFIKK